MTSLPLSSRVYVCSVVALGAMVLAGAIGTVQFPQPGLFVALLVLSVISSSVKVDLPIGIGTSCISLSYAVDFTALLLLGPAAAILIAVPSVLAQCTLRMSQRNPEYKTLFSIATVMISIAATGATYTWFGGTYGRLPAAPLQPLMAAAMMHFLVNSSAVAAAVALTTRRNVFRVWHDTFLWSVSSYVVGAIGAGITLEVFHSAGQWQTMLAFVPLGLTYRTYRIYLRRIADEQRRVAEWSQLHHDSIEVLARAIQAKDEGGSCHVERVQFYASALARRLNLSDLDRQAIETAALLHDIGKLAVPQHILSKPGPLTADERKKMQVHAEIGAQIVSAVRFPYEVAPLIRSHHERWDGRGYPAGIRGHQIPLGARILAVVDCFDALTSPRPYRSAVSRDEALARLQQDAGEAFDPAVVAHFTAIIEGLTPLEDETLTGATAFSSTGPRSGIEGSSGGADVFAEIASAKHETNTLYAIAQTLGRSMSLADTMALVTEKLTTLLPFASCALFVRRGNEDLRCRFATGPGADLLDDATVAEGYGLSGWVAQHRRPLVNGVPAAEFKAAGIAMDPVELRSALVCPLRVGDKVIGTIALFHSDTAAYTDDHRRVLDEVANQAAPVVHNALLFERTQEQAFKDELTGLSNPRALQSQVTRELARAQRTSVGFAMILFDLDDFKIINDDHGHLAGDRALQAVARTLQDLTRPYDTCVRYGGDEFVVLLSACTRAEAEERRRLMQEAVAAIALRADDGETLTLHVSAGVSAFPEDGNTYERLLARADRRMYRNKAHSKSASLRSMPGRAPVLADVGYSAAQ